MVNNLKGERLIVAQG